MQVFGKGLAKCLTEKTSPKNHRIEGTIPIEMLVKLEFHDKSPLFLLLYQIMYRFKSIYR